MMLLYSLVKKQKDYSTTLTYKITIYFNVVAIVNEIREVKLENLLAKIENCKEVKLRILSPLS